MKAITDLKDKDDLPEILTKKVFVLTMKWKKEIDEWLKNPITPILSEQDLSKKELLSPLESSLNKKWLNPKYLEKDKEEKNEKFLEKRAELKPKIFEKDNKNKKRMKYERKKETHHNKLRENKEAFKGKIDSKYLQKQKKEYNLKRTKSVRFFLCENRKFITKF